MSDRLVDRIIPALSLMVFVSSTVVMCVGMAQSSIGLRFALAPFALACFALTAGSVWWLVKGDS